MAAPAGIKQYWTALLEKPELLTFDYLAAQRVWQKYCSMYGAAKFHGNPTYIAFMQAFMMDGVKGTRLISYLGDLYQEAADPSATAKTVLKTAIKAAGVGILDYQKQMKDVEKANLNPAWVNAAHSACAYVLQRMAQGLEVGPGDLG